MRNLVKIISIPFIMLVLVCTSGDADAQSYIDGMLSHKITVHYPDHTVIAVVKPTDMVSTQSDATYFWFSGNQINTTQGGYSGKLLNGEYQDFYLNKNLKEKGFFDRGLKTGLWKNWTDNGILKDAFTFKNGIKNGSYIKYDTIGRVMQKGHYKQDLLSGKQITMLGDSVVVLYYQHGKVKEKKSLVPGFIYKIFPKKHSQPVNQQPADRQPVKSASGSALPIPAQP
jgi:hypothetical protein